MNANDKNVKGSKFSGNKKSTFMIIIILILVIFIGVEIAALVKSGKNRNNPSPTDVAIATATQAPADNTEQTGATPTPAADNTQEPATPTANVNPATDAPAVTATSTPTPAPTSTPTHTPTPTPTATSSNPTVPHGIDDVAARIVDPSTIDFSFLNDVSREPFEDCSAGSFDWYPGAVKRDANGNVTYPWDRYPSTLNFLKLYGGIYRKNTDKKVCYLTFDCGYENGNTEKILDTLKAKNVQAIFFVTGGFVDEGSKTLPIMKRMLAEGHLIGSHTEHHKVMPTLSDTEFVEELNSVYRKLKNALGNDFTMLFYRPPQGASCPRDLALASYLGYYSVFWSFAYGDYEPSSQPDPGPSLQKMKDTLHPGCVYLLHAVSSTNATVLGDLIDYIRAEGYEIRRIDH